MCCCELFLIYFFFFALLLKFISTIKVINLKTPSAPPSKERGVCVVTLAAVTTFLEYLLLNVLKCQINCLSHAKSFGIFVTFFSRKSNLIV